MKINSGSSALKSLAVCSAVFVTLLSSEAVRAQSVNFTGSYAENFNSMGAAGITPPTGWSMKTGNSGTTNTTWATSIPGTGANSVASMVATAGGLTAITDPAVTNNNGFNATATIIGDVNNRLLAVSPTTVSGGALQLSLTNNTGAAIGAFDLSYDIRRFTAATTANSLPGYWLFYSLDGTTWTNATAFNSTISTVPNSVGVTNVGPTSLTLSGSWANGANLLVRWVDDNALETSPDQIIGLDNVLISAIPEPTTTALGLGLAGFATAAALRRRRPALGSAA